MATFQFKGIDEYVASLNRIYGGSRKYIGSAIYHGAGYTFEVIEKATRALPVDDSMEHKAMRSGIRTLQKKALMASLGIAKMRQDGTFLNVKIGYDGYNNIKSKEWPKGQPNAMIARSIEAGTSFLPKTGYLRKATRSARKGCEEVMRLAIDKEIAALK